MKDKRLVHHCQSAKIYRQYYKPSFNLLRLLKSVLSVFLTASPAGASHYNRFK